MTVDSVSRGAAATVVPLLLAGLLAAAVQAATPATPAPAKARPAPAARPSAAQGTPAPAVPAPKTAAELKKEGDRLYDAKEWVAAGAPYLELVERYPGDEDAVYARKLAAVCGRRAEAARLAAESSRLLEAGMLKDAMTKAEEALGREGRNAEAAAVKRQAEAGLGPRAGEVRLNAKDGLEYVWIPAGTFQMGCVAGDGGCREDEKPRHEVTLTRGFWMGKTEAIAGTQRRVGAPPLIVTWDDAKEFCAWSGGRLPTDAEWEYAARGGRDGLKYPWGDAISHEEANYGKDECCDGRASGRDRWKDVAPVGSFAANGFGLFDMSGNASEWVDVDPVGPASGRSRVRRGGSAYGAPNDLVVSRREFISHLYLENSGGFRCVHDVLRTGGEAAAPATPVPPTAQPTERPSTVRGTSAPAVTAPKTAAQLKAEGDRLYDAEDWVAAGSRYRTLVERYPGDGSAEDAAKAAEVCGARAEAARLVEAALRLLAAGQLKDAMTRAEEALAQEAGNAQAVEVWRQAESRLGRRAGAIRVNAKDGLRYVWIPPGTFQMGCVAGDGDCREDEKPRHEVTLSRGFWMGRTEVPEDAPRFSLYYPATLVSWDSAKNRCGRSGGRLPTEAEWEYAARGGRVGLKYPWGHAVTEKEASFGKRRGDDWSPVGRFEANGFGLFDMSGNALEWVADSYDEGYYGNSPEVDPKGPESGSLRVLRGGCWTSLANQLRSSHRDSAKPSYRIVNVGFRCVLDALPGPPF